MTCANSCEYLSWNDEVHTPLVEWQKLLSQITKREINRRLLSKFDLHHRFITRQYSSPAKKQERLSLPRNSVNDDTFVHPLLVSASSSVVQSSTDIARQVSPSTKRYVSSFKTVLNPANSRQTQRSNHANDNVVVFKLTKDHTKEHSDTSSQSSKKYSSFSMASTTTTTATTVSSTPPPKQLSFSSSPWRSSATLRTEGLKRRATHYDSSVVTSDNTYLSIPSNSTPSMATSTTSHSSLFAYGSTVSGGNTVRQRALAETAANSLLITTERLKTHTSSSMRPARQSSTTTMPSAYMTSQQLQRNVSLNTRSRAQHEKSTNSKDLYEYPDPFTNCPSDILSKLAQLTKLQMETVEWEKKRRFTKKKPGTNGTTQGKDSP